MRRLSEAKTLREARLKARQRLAFEEKKTRVAMALIYPESAKAFLG